MAMAMDTMAMVWATTEDTGAVREGLPSLMPNQLLLLMPRLIPITTMDMDMD